MIDRKFKKELSKIKINYILVFFIVIAAFLLGFIINKKWEIKSEKQQARVQTSSNPYQKTLSQADIEKIQNQVLKKSYTFKIKWQLGQQMIEDGVIDKQKLAKAVTGKDNLPQEMDKYLTSDQSSIELNQQNAQFWVDVLWGLGLSNNNPILTSGPMVQSNTAGFASTGGYTIGVYQPMDIYAKHQYIDLSERQKEEVYEIASNIYRPCCDNPTIFPDCNHGMAALGLVELMVSQGFSKDEIYKTVLAFNTYWFPQTYLDTAYYFKQNGKDYSKVSPQEILSKTFSSASGYESVYKRVGNVQWSAIQNGGSCGA